MISAALVLLAACGEKEPELNLPPGVSALPANAAVAVPPPGDPRCQPASTRIVFRDSTEWNSFWEYMGPGGCPRPPALPRDFDWRREMIAFAGMGKRTSALDSLAIIGTGVVRDTVIVAVRRTNPGPGCPPGNVVTYPRAAARIPLDRRHVRFVEERRRIPCGGG